jgi:hypothetical protein
MYNKPDIIHVVVDALSDYQILQNPQVCMIKP